MRKLIILFIIILNSCSSDKAPEPQPSQTYYSIVARGEDNRGDYIIIKVANYTNKRYSVSNYQDYLNQSTLCEPITLIEQPL